MKKPQIPMNRKIEMYNLYKNGLRGQEVAEKFGISIQHLYRIIREIEGKPNWKKTKSMPYGDKYNKRNNLFTFQKPMRDYEERIKV